MNKENLLELIKLLSAIESWSFSNGQKMPDYLFEKLDRTIDLLSEELLNGNID